MRFLILIAFFLTVAFSPSVSAQAISSSDLDETWERLDLSETSTGILANRRAVFLDPTAFQGTASADTLDPLEWEVLYGQIRMSAANPSVLPDPATLATRTRSELAAGRLPIAVFYQPFDYVDAQDFQSGRLMVDASGAVEQVYRPTASSLQGNQVYTQPSPFDTGTVFAAGALYGPELGAAWLGAAVAGEPVTFIIPSDLVIVPQGTPPPSSVVIDFADGLGFRVVPVAQPVTVTYSTPGVRVIRVRMTIGGFTFTAPFNFFVAERDPGISPPAPAFPTRAGACYHRSYGSDGTDYFTGADAVRRVFCDVEPGQNYAWRPTRNGYPTSYSTVLDDYDGPNRVAKYDYAVSLAPGHTRIENPIIVVSGYDPLGNTGLVDVYRTLNRYDSGSPAINLNAALKSQGYDIVVMDYADSQDFVQRNGLALVHLIRTLQSEMDAANPAGPNEIPAVIGLSMGGLVARYALSYIEHETQAPHRVGLFVSYDSPQQGAYVPVGLQMAFADIYDTYDGVLDIVEFFGLDGGGDTYLDRRLFGAAAQQLLTFWVGRELGATSPSAIQTAIREDLYDDFLSLGDYPDDVRRVAISNGNGAGLAQVIAPNRTDLSQGRMQPGALALDLRAKRESAWGLSSRRFRFETYNAPSPAQGIRSVYERSNQRCFGICGGWDLLVAAQMATPNSYDGVPGGFLESYKPFREKPYWTTRSTTGGGLAHILLGLSASVEALDVGAERHAFVPTLSGLDWNATASSRTSFVNSTFLNQNLSAPLNRTQLDQRTPFDAIHTADDLAFPSGVGNESQPHLFITNGIKSFILDQLTKPIPDRTPQPLAASISGVSLLDVGQYGTWTAAVQNGSGPTSYQWSYTLYLAVCGGVGLNGETDPFGGQSGQDPVGEMTPPGGSSEPMRSRAGNRTPVARPRPSRGA